MKPRNWEEWAAGTFGRRALVEPPEFVLHRAFGIMRRSRRRVPVWMATAAALVIGAFGVVMVVKSDRPGLPPRPVESTVRSGELEVVAPVGRIDAVPQRLEWEAEEDAASYTVRVLAVDDRVLFETQTTASSTELAPDFTQTLHSAVNYAWVVEAYDENGNLIARSQRTGFEVRP